LNPAFRNLTASDFEVIELGYNPAVAAPASLASVSIKPASITGGQPGTGTVTLSGAASAGGAVVSLASANPAASVPGSITVPASAAAANFTVSTSTVAATTTGNITATYGDVIKSATFTVNPPAPVALLSLSLNPKTVVGGSSLVGTVTLNKVTSSPVVVSLASSKPKNVMVPAIVTVPAGASSAAFNISTTTTNKKINATISASYGGATKSATLAIVRR
jgi:hypothetical protein